MGGFRDWQDDGAPDVRVIWDKTPVARRPHLCDVCNEEIAPGQRYESVGYYEDGTFVTQKRHLWAYQYPSGCPRHRAKDLLEIEGAA